MEGADKTRKHLLDRSGSATDSSRRVMQDKENPNESKPRVVDPTGEDDGHPSPLSFDSLDLAEPLLSAIRAIKARAELMHRQSGHTSPTPGISSGN